jgi:hypothetical protein
MTKEEDIVDISEKCMQIVTMSEIFQPSEDDLAERILSQKDEPFNINFDIGAGKFSVNLKLIPEDERNIFISNTDFICLQLNEDKKVTIKQNDIIKVLSTDGNDNVFGYLADPSQTKEILLIPLNKVSPLVHEYPISSKRQFRMTDWQILVVPQTRASKEDSSKTKKSWTQKYEKAKVETLKSKIHLEEGEEAKVAKVAYFKMDFNTHPLSICYAEELTNSKHSSLNVLSAQQGDIINITNTDSITGWVEGYLAKDPSKNLGLVHSRFIAYF